MQVSHSIGLPYPRGSNPPRLCLRGLSGEYADIWLACAAVRGLSTLEEVLLRSQQPSSLLERLQSSRMLAFPVYHVIWMPNFQFGMDGFTIRPCIERTIRELECFWDAVEITLWFCTANAGLRSCAPLHEVAVHPQRVIEAAAACRRDQNAPSPNGLVGHRPGVRVRKDLLPAR
jgi:hypothetical protein